jgi:hypothetical protein
MLDFKFYIHEDEYKNAERHIMNVIKNSIKQIGHTPVFEKDQVHFVDPVPQSSRDGPNTEAQKPSNIEDSLIEEKVPRKVDSASNSLDAAQSKEVIDEL